MEQFILFNETVDVYREKEVSDLPLDCIHALVELQMGHGDYSLQDFTEAIQSCEFIYGEVDISIMKRAIEAHEDYPDTFEEFLKGYLNGKDAVGHGTSVWPVIIDENEVIADGWHRFASYASMGIEKIPILIIH